MSGRDWRPTAPSVKYDKGAFSFLIALGRQLELALELELDGSAPPFVSDALGVLANGLDGLAREPLDDEETSGELDDGSEAADDGPAWDETQVAGDRTRGLSGPRVVGGTVSGTRAMKADGLMAVRRAPAVGSNKVAVPRGTPKKGRARRGKKSKK